MILLLLELNRIQYFLQKPSLEYEVLVAVVDTQIGMVRFALQTFSIHKKLRAEKMQISVRFHSSSMKMSLLKLIFAAYSNTIVAVVMQKELSKEKH
jgi:hypothetical protein